MKGVVVDVVALAAQIAVFALGLVLSLVLGMVLAAHLDGAGGLIIATLVAGGGLLGAAVASQALRDFVIHREES
jgi:adenine/guanine phosphoribosyltransferase-like PRPP-binding protein